MTGCTPSSPVWGKHAARGGNGARNRDTAPAEATTHTRARETRALPQQPAPATNSRRWQAPRCESSERPGPQMQTARSCPFRSCRASSISRPWRHWVPAEKIERLLGMSLDRCCEILSWAPNQRARPAAPRGAGPGAARHLEGRTRALLDGKLGREAARQRNRAAILDEIARRFEGPEKANGVVTY